MIAAEMQRLDAAILVAMKARPAGIFTYTIRNIVQHEHNFPTVTAGTVRRRLERLEKLGTVSARRWGPGCHNEWKMIEVAA